MPIVGSTATTRGLRLTAVDSAGRRKKVSTIVVEPIGVEGTDETGTTATEDEPETGDEDKDTPHDEQ